MGQQEPHHIQQGEMEMLYLSQTKPLHHTGWGPTGREQLSWKGPSEQQATEQSAPCPGNNEGEQCPGLCEQDHSQQIKQIHHSALFSAHHAAPGTQFLSLSTSPTPASPCKKDVDKIVCV